MKKLILSLVLAPVLHTLPCGAMDSDEDPAAGAAQSIPPASIPRGLAIKAAVARLKNPTMNCLEIRALTKYVTATPEDRMEGIVDAVERLKNPTMGSSKIGRLIQALTPITSKDKMKSIVVAVARLKNPDMNSHSISELIEALTPITSKDKMKSIVVAVARLKNPTMEVWEIRWLIQALTPITSEDQMKSIVAAVERLKNPTMSGYLISALINTLTATPEGRMEAIVAAVERLKNPEMSGWQISDLIEALTAITPEDRMEGIVASVERLKNPTMSGSEIGRLIQALTPITSEDQMKSIVAAVERLKKPTMSGSEIGRLIQALTPITSKDKMEDIVAAVERLKNPTMGSLEIGDLIQTFTPITSEDRMEGIVASVERLKNPTMSGSEIGRLIQALTPITSEDQMKSIVAAVARLKTDTMDGYEIRGLIQAITATPEGHMAGIVDGAEALIRRGMNGHDRFRILEELRNLGLSNEATVARAHRVADRLNEITQAHPGLTDGQVLNAIVTLLPDPEAAFDLPRADIVGQEALMRQRGPIYDAYTALATSPDYGPLIAKLLPAPDAVNFGADYITVRTHLNNAMAGLAVDSPKAFRLTKALEGLDYLAVIRADFSSRRDMPTVHQLVALMVGLAQWETDQHMKQAETQAMQHETQAMRVAIAANLDKVWRAFPEIRSHLDASEAFRNVQAMTDVPLRNRTLADLVAAMPQMIDLIKVMNGESETLPANGRHVKRLLGILAQAKKAAALYESPMWNCLTEALFMAVRGHNITLTNPAEPNKRACPDGVHLNLLQGIGLWATLNGEKLSDELAASLAAAAAVDSMRCG